MSDEKTPESRPLSVIDDYIGKISPPQSSSHSSPVNRRAQSIRDDREAAGILNGKTPEESFVNASTNQQQLPRLRQEESPKIVNRWVIVGAVAVAGVAIFTVGKYMLGQPAQAEQLPVSPAPVSTQEESGGLFDKIPGYTEFSDALGNRSNGSSSEK